MSDSDKIDCPKCGDYTCDVCGGGRDPGSQPATVPRRRRTLRRRLMGVALLALMVSGAGFVAKVCYLMFIFGWELLP